MSKKILVVGDSCLDEFVYCDANRLAPDLPVPVLNELEITRNPGMAMNVYRNIANYISDVDIVTNLNWEKYTKRRYVHQKSNHHFFRVDSSETVSEIDFKSFDFNYEMIVISDYNKGFLSEADITFICENHPLVFLDSKKAIDQWAAKAAWIKINDHEFNNSRFGLDSDIRKKVIHTLGENGCELDGRHFPTESHPVRDTSGAGDSFMAGLVVKFFETRDIERSIKFANEVASKVVQVRGVTTI